METEVWKDIPGYERIYQASSLGNIRSLDRICNHKTKGHIKLKGRILKKYNDKSGYELVKLSNNNVKPLLKVHRLICLTFFENPENKPQVNHINGIKNDNRLNNLEWATRSENVNHAIKSGLITFNKGENHHLYKKKNPHTSRPLINLSNNEIYASIKDASKTLGVSVSILGHMLRGNTKNTLNIQYHNDRTRSNSRDNKRT